jgi:hypothetical protein
MFCAAVLLLLTSRDILLIWLNVDSSGRGSSMSQLLEKALAQVRKLPELEQDAIATLILDELSDEQRWDDTFAKTQDKLASMAAKAREDIQAGRIRRVGMDEL